MSNLDRSRYWIQENGGSEESVNMTLPWMRLSVNKGIETWARSERDGIWRRKSLDIAG